jgi:hypothetical protein
MTKSPLARQTGLIIEDLPDEVLVYDSDRDSALCLNRTAASVWKRCDGKTTPARLARLIEKEFRITGGDEVVSLALGQLEESHLLIGKAPVPVPRISRRELVRRLGIAAAVVPVITLILVPTARAQATCTQNQGSCVTDGDCCSGCCLNSSCVSSDICNGRKKS